MYQFEKNVPIRYATFALSAHVAGNIFSLLVSRLFFPFCFKRQFTFGSNKAKYRLDLFFCI